MNEIMGGGGILQIGPLPWDLTLDLLPWALARKNLTQLKAKLWAMVTKTGSGANIGIFVKGAQESVRLPQQGSILGQLFKSLVPKPESKEPPPNSINRLSLYFSFF